MTTFLEELKNLNNKNKPYFDRKVEEIKDDIRCCVRDGRVMMWITFKHDDGECFEIVKIVKYFKKEGLKVKIQKKLDPREYTCVLFSWSI